MPNIKNIESCERLKRFLRKIVYVPPLLCPYAPESSSRSAADVITSFYIINPQNRPRRKLLYDQLMVQGFRYENIPRVFGRRLYSGYYKRSKILVNVHQTDFDDTFEELRVLPALLNGLVVIAEDSPLKEHIPYHDYIVWCDYGSIASRAIEVLANYDYYYAKIHGPDSGLAQVIEDMRSGLKRSIDGIAAGLMSA